MYPCDQSFIYLACMTNARLTSAPPRHTLTNSIATMLKRHTRRARGRRRSSHIKAIIRIFLSTGLVDVSSRRAAPAGDIAARVSGLSGSKQPPRPPRGGVAGSSERSRSLDGPIEHRPSDRTSIGIPVPSRSSAATTNLPRPSARVFAPQADTGYERVNRAKTKIQRRPPNEAARVPSPRAKGPAPFEIKRPFHGANGDKCRGQMARFELAPRYASFRPEMIIYSRRLNIAASLVHALAY